MTTYPIARYHFTFKVLTPIRMPEYAGSTLRGAFGQALRRTACMTRLKACTGCPLHATCPYATLFEPLPPETHELQKFSQIPSPYIIEPDGWGLRLYQPGEELHFSMVLMGNAIRQLALIAYAWKRAFEHEVAHGTAELIDVQYEDGAERVSVYDAVKGQILPHEAKLTLPSSENAPLELAIQTPMRLQENGKPLHPESLTARRLMMALVRRTSLLQEFYLGGRDDIDFPHLAEQAEAVTSSHQLKWQDWTRYSSRQNQKMQLGGVVGQWRLDDVPQPFMPYLILGQWLHVGKNATFGLGKYTVTNTEDTSG